MHDAAASTTASDSCVFRGLAAMQVAPQFELGANDLPFGIAAFVTFGLLLLQIAFTLKDFGGSLRGPYVLARVTQRSAHRNSDGRFSGQQAPEMSGVSSFAAWS